MRKLKFGGRLIMSKKIRVTAILLAALTLLSLRAECSKKAGTDPLPSLSAESAFLIEGDTNDCIYEANADKRLPIASTTKIMTALVAIENADADAIVEVPKEAVGVEGSSAYLAEGERVSVKDLLYTLLLESANDSAVALAVAVAGSVERFSDLMNVKAASMGLRNTHFTNPHGLDDKDHYSSARDLGLLTVNAMKNSLFSEIVSTYSYDAFTDPGSKPRTVVNHNRLLKTLEGAIGVKTGFTKRSGRCLVSAVDRDGIYTVAVTLNDPNDWSDHKQLHEYARDVYEYRKLAEVGSVFYNMPVIGGDSRTVRCSNSESLSAPVRKCVKITSKIEASRFVPATVNKGDAIAKIVFYADGKPIGSLPLFAASTVKNTSTRRTFFERLLEFLGRDTG